MTRTDHYRRIAIAKNSLIDQEKLTEADYRGMLAMHGAINDQGYFSAKTLSTPALEQVFKKLQEMGYQDNKIRQKGRLKVVNTPQQKKIWALWFELKNRGQIESTKRQALDGWISKQTDGKVNGINALSLKENQQHADQLINQLKAWVKRVQSPAKAQG